MKKLLAVFFLMISVVLPQSSFAATEIVDPNPVLVPANMKSEDLVKNIKRALVGRGWAIEKESAGKIDAVLYLRSHVARVSLNYSDKDVKLVYVSSENLDYKEKKGKRYIHKNYLSWVNNVMMDINKNLQLAALD
jgi:hypothetical protein